MKITPKVIQSRLKYNARKGIFIHKPRNPSMFDSLNPLRACNVWNTRYAGTVAGYTTNNGYVKIKLFDVQYFAHDLVWCMEHGYVPDFALDHRDTIKNRNHIRNLRPTDHAQNGWNRGKNKNNTSGHKGVVIHGPSWRHQIWANGKLYLGTHKTYEEACDAYNAAARKLHGKFAQVSSR